MSNGVGRGRRARPMLGMRGGTLVLSVPDGYV